jgi:hypothetical protein
MDAPDIEQVPASGSCARCGDALDLASTRRDGTWYCSAACASGGSPLDAPPPAVPESWLYGRPRRHFRRRAPKELKRS